MPLETRHFKEEIQELLDNRLNHEARLKVEQHLESCEECRREWEALRWTKDIAWRERAPESVPAKLEENILAALALEDDRSSAKTVPLRIWRRRRRAILAYGFVLLVGVALALSYFIFRTQLRKAPDLPSAVARDYRNYKTEKLSLMLRTGEAEEMESFFSERGVAFNTRVFDLNMMNYHLEGGRVHELIGRQSALFVYRGEGNKILICQMYPGQALELPASGAILRENKGIRFYIYRVHGLTVAFWQEGAITCALTSDIDPEEVVQLAFAKAVKI